MGVVREREERGGERRTLVLHGVARVMVMVMREREERERERRRWFAAWCCKGGCGGDGEREGGEGERGER